MTCILSTNFTGLSYLANLATTVPLPFSLSLFLSHSVYLWLYVHTVVCRLFVYKLASYCHISFVVCTQESTWEWWQKEKEGGEGAVSVSVSTAVI